MGSRPKASNIAARVLLVFGYLAASLAYSAWWAGRVAFDPTATRGAAHAILATSSVQKTLGDQITKQVDSELADQKVDPKVSAAVHAALRDPRVTAAFADAIAQIHQAILTNSNGTVVLDTHALTNAVHDALAATDPKLAAKVKKQGNIEVKLGGDKLPHIGGARDSVETVEAVAFLAAALLIGGALLLCHDRKMFGRLGRRIAYLSLPPLFLFALLPRLLGNASGDAPQVGGAVLRSYGSRVLPSAIALLVVGIAVATCAVVLPRLLGLARAATDNGEGEESEAESRTSAIPPTPLRPSGPTEPAITEKLYL